jgi:hypothetical protein
MVESVTGPATTPAPLRTPCRTTRPLGPTNVLAAPQIPGLGLPRVDEANRLHRPPDGPAAQPPFP